MADRYTKRSDLVFRNTGAVPAYYNTTNKKPLNDCICTQMLAATKNIGMQTTSTLWHPYLENSLVGADIVRSE